ncbi:hypothetical protein Clacol_005662 [Clathrus columnatus]|uniref:Glycoside hydrolase family 92 protein n=1 Tax=Clathrus columnatus TaxID=1419009 RepID=A0AAV5A9Z7_9AGAM|nr:hypothetical protein Clacol_005662 [Clathrus columnatus]
MGRKMILKLHILFVVFLLLHDRVGKTATVSIADDENDLAKFVNLFIGTINDGHVFPGATVPHGMVKAGLDTDSPGNQAGYDSNPYYNATGFSQLHDDGTGGGASLSNFKVWPIASCRGGLKSCKTSLKSRKTRRKILQDGTPADEASPGYFSSVLINGIKAELTATRRTALHRYTFPAGTQEPRILIDVTNDGQNHNLGPFVNINPSTGRMIGSGVFLPSFGSGQYPAHFCADFQAEGYHFDGPKEYGIWKADVVEPNVATFTKIAPEVGGILGFKRNPDFASPTTILVRVGVSLISRDQACTNAEEEIPVYDFDLVRTSARNQWNDLLGRIRVDSSAADPETTILFYSSIPVKTLYGSHKNLTMIRFIAMVILIISLKWDTYRTLYPLMSLHDPVTFARIIRGMIDIQKYEGWLPECRSATVRQWIQGGSNADPILGEFFVKFHKQASTLNVSADDLYTALIVDAEKEPPNWDLQGRQASLWIKYGMAYSYFLINTITKVSRALEYAFDDFSIAQVAKLLEKTEDTLKLRNTDGSFTYTDPRHCSVKDPTHSTCYLDGRNRDGFYESSPMIYSQYVPHDTAQLILLQGGNEKFIERLDHILDQKYFDSTNEPSQQIPFMYHYADRPAFSTQRSRRIITEEFNITRSGLPGNDDSGAMGSFVLFYLAGLYPVPATTQYLLSSPYFPSISFYNPLFGTNTTIITKNFQGNPPSGIGTLYVKSVTINGQPWKSNCYLEFETFVQGGLIELELTNDDTVGCGTLPPSLSTGGFD